MANYIKEEILCEAYTHLKIDLYDDKEALEQLKLQLIPFFEERAKFLLGEEVKVKIEFEEGSLKTKLQVIGSAGLLLLSTPLKNPHVAIPAMVMAYPAFRAGVSQLAQDATSLAHSANLEVIFRTKTQYCDRVTIEKRKGVFGRLDALLTELERLGALAGDDEKSSYETKLRETTRVVEQLLIWNGKTEKLFDKIDSAVTKECVSGGLYEAVKRLPKEIKWAKSLSNDDLKIKIAKSDPQLFGQLSAIVAQYTATRQSILDKMKSRYDVVKQENKS